MQNITFTINGQSVTGRNGNTILDVARQYGIPIPTLCHESCLDAIGACRICLVEDKKQGSLVAACVTPIADGMVIQTDSAEVIENRKVIVKLMIANHPDSCLVCDKGNRCALRRIAADLGIGRVEYYPMPSPGGKQELNPFIARDLSKCILCAKCIRADHNLVVEGAIDYKDRGFEAHPATLNDEPLERSECTFCGTCLEICPTGALFERNKQFCGTATERVATTCGFCGCGCAYWITVSHGRAVGVQPGIAGSVNGLTLCSKGRFGYEYISGPGRLQRPLVRKDGCLEETSWDEALQTAARGFMRIMKKNGGDGLALLSGAHATNEEAFLLKQFAGSVLHTSNVACSTTYMTALVEAMQEDGAGVRTDCSIADLEDMDVILLAGANPTETAPVVGYSIKRGVRNRHSRLIVIDPVAIKLVRFAHRWLRPAVRTDAYVLLAFMRSLLSCRPPGSNVSKEAAAELRGLERKIRAVLPSGAQSVTGIEPSEIQEAAAAFLAARKRAVVFGNGIIQQPAGRDLVRMLCTVGRMAEMLSGRNTALFPLVKHSNAMGCFHMGLMNGRTPEGIISRILSGQVAGLWGVGDDPLVSLPGTGRIAAALDKLELLVVSESYLSGTGRKAHVVFPSATFAEKTGTVTSMEGRVQRVRAAVDCAGESRPDGETARLLASYLDAPAGFCSERDLTAEIIDTVSLYAGIKRSDLDSGTGCRLPGPDSSQTPAGLFVPESLSGAPAPDPDYPYALLAGGIVFQLGSGCITRHSRRLNAIVREDYVEMNPHDAAAEGLREGDAVRVASAGGAVSVRVRLTDRVARTVLFLPLSFIRNSGLMTGPHGDGCHDFCHVRIERDIHETAKS